MPLLALNRLHVVKQDSSQLGASAREAVKFLDRVTSGKDGVSEDAILLQGPDDQYATWAEVEEHLQEVNTVSEKEEQTQHEEQSQTVTFQALDGVAEDDENYGAAGGALSQALLSKLNFSSKPPPRHSMSSSISSQKSPSPPSSKASPEIASVKLAKSGDSIVPPVLQPLLNSVVWYAHNGMQNVDKTDILFLTNAADTASYAKSFGATPRTIHQLRAMVEETHPHVRVHSAGHSKRSSQNLEPSAVTLATSEPRGLFKYEDGSDEEELVFKPRGRGARGSASTRASPLTASRGKNSTSRSPIPKFSTPVRNGPPKPEVPTEEIDPDSFDRGDFARGSTPLANTGPPLTAGYNFHPAARGSPFRGTPTGPRGNFNRGRSYQRGGSIRGRGSLFVP